MSSSSHAEEAKAILKKLGSEIESEISTEIRDSIKDTVSSLSSQVASRIPQLVATVAESIDALPFASAPAPAIATDRKSNTTTGNSSSSTKTESSSTTKSTSSSTQKEDDKESKEEETIKAKVVHFPSSLAHTFNLNSNNNKAKPNGLSKCNKTQNDTEVHVVLSTTPSPPETMIPTTKATTDADAQRAVHLYVNYVEDTFQLVFIGLTILTLCLFVVLCLLACFSSIFMHCSSSLRRFSSLVATLSIAASVYFIVRLFGEAESYQTMETQCKAHLVELKELKGKMFPPSSTTCTKSAAATTATSGNSSSK